MIKRVFIDASVLVKLFDDNAPVKQAAARNLIGDVDNTTLVTSALSMADFYEEVTSKFSRNLETVTAKQALNDLTELTIVQIDSDLVCFSINDMKRMKANPGDLVFVEDSRWWLGGLKSAHCIYGEPHNEDGLVYITNKHLSHGQFIEGLKLKAEKEM